MRRLSSSRVFQKLLHFERGKPKCTHSRMRLQSAHLLLSRVLAVLNCFCVGSNVSYCFLPGQKNVCLCPDISKLA